MELSNLAKNKPAVAAIPEVIEEVSSNNEESLGIVGLPQPDQPQLLNPAAEPDVAQPKSVLIVAQEPQIEEEHLDVLNPEELQIRDKSVGSLSSIAKEICEEEQSAPEDQKSSEDGSGGELKSLDLQREVEKIEQSINKSLRAETKQPPKDSHSSNDDSVLTVKEPVAAATENLRAELEQQMAAPNRSVARVNESSFQYVPTMMDEQPRHTQVNKPLFDEESDIIGEEEDESQNVSSQASAAQTQQNPAMDFYGGHQQTPQATPNIVVSRQDALVEPPKRGSKAQAAAPGQNSVATLRHAVGNQARTAFGNGEK